MNSDLMDVKEAAAIIGVTVGRVRQLAAAGKLKGERLGGPERGLWVFRRADVVAYAARPRRAGRPRKAETLVTTASAAVVGGLTNVD